MKWLLSRLREPSTAAGVAVLSQVAKTVPAWLPYGQLLDSLTAIAAGYAVLAPEAPKKDPVK